MSEHAVKVSEDLTKRPRMSNPRVPEETAAQFKYASRETPKGGSTSAGSPIDPKLLSTNVILQLQRTIGNRAAQLIFQHIPTLPTAAARPNIGSKEQATNSENFLPISECQPNDANDIELNVHELTHGGQQESVTQIAREQLVTDKTPETHTFFVSVAGIRGENLTKVQATMMLRRVVNKLQTKYQKGKTSHIAWLRANKILGHNYYPSISIWNNAEQALVNANLVLQKGQIGTATEHLQKADQLIEIATKRYQQPIVDEEFIEFAEKTVSVLEFVKDLAFSTLEKALEIELHPALSIAAKFASHAIVSVIEGLAEQAVDLFTNTDDAKFEDWIANFVQSKFTLDLSTVGDAIGGDKGEIIGYLIEMTTTIIISANREIAKREKSQKQALTASDKLEIWLNRFRDKSVVALVSDIAVKAAKKKAGV